jgi:DNA replication and repair protein RecF
MFLNSIVLQGFRSFKEKSEFSFDPKFTLIIGPNSVGKTNLIEALYFLNYGHGFREKKSEELINSGSSSCLLEARFKDKTAETSFGIRLQKLESVAIKAFFVNGIKKTTSDYLKRTLNVVLFQPDDLLLITHAPDLRRNYLDRILSRSDFEYAAARRNYSRGLYKRNKLLENSRSFSQQRLNELIRFWDGYLFNQALILQEARKKLVADFNKHHALDGLSFKIDYRPNYFINAKNSNQLAQELRFKRTLTGPQLDDFLFLKLDYNAEKPLAQFGSRSQQRLCVLWLKINELRFLTTQNKQPPILLMDDIFSELDSENSQRILKVTRLYQTVVTTAHSDILLLLKKSIPELKVITLTP